jgi:glycosyltransferase involved in cell wall biosynthesis
VARKHACIVYYTYFKYSALLIREAKALQEAGFEVDVICIREPGDPPFEVVDGMNVYKLQRRLYNERSPVMFLVKLLAFFGLCFGLISLLHLKKGYDVVHVTSPPDFLVFAALLPRLFGAKVILDIHDIVPELYQRKFEAGSNHVLIRALRLIERLSCRFSHHVIIVTELWRRLLLERGVPEEKVVVLMNVPDPEVFDPERWPAKRDERYFTLIYHGSYAELFGVETLVAAMKPIGERLPNARLIMWGNGPLRGKLEEMIERLGLQERVVLGPSLPFDKLPPRLAEADLGVVPTRGGTFADKALSMKSLDYIAMRVPMVITRTSASTHYYDESMVRFFEPDDPESLAEAVVELAGDPERRRRMVEASQRFYREHNWFAYRQRYYALLGIPQGGPRAAQAA